MATIPQDLPTDVLDDAPWPDAPEATHTARTTFRSVVADVAARAKDKLPAAVNGRVESAVKLVLQHDVYFLDDGTIEVGSSSDPMKTYRLEGTSCTCQDFQHGQAPEGWCQHRIAAGIAKRVEQVLAQQAQEPREDPRSALPEAPASCNVYVMIGGHKVQVTLRDTDERRMLGRLQVLLAEYPAAPTAAAAVPTSPPPAPVCQWHGAMKASTKHGGWYCPAKMADGSYCKERQGA